MGDRAILFRPEVIPMRAPIGMIGVLVVEASPVPLISDRSVPDELKLVPGEITSSTMTL